MVSFFLRSVLLFWLVYVLPTNLQAQTPQDIERLKKQSKALSGKIRNIDKKATLYSRQIDLSQKKVDLLNQEIQYLENDINRNKRKLRTLKSEKDNLTDLLNKLLVYTYKTRNSRHQTAFLLSSKEFSTAYKRYLYLKFYRHSLYNKISDLKNTELEIKYTLHELQKEKAKLYELSARKTDELLAQKATVDELTSIRRSLRTNRTKIEKEIREKQQAAARLNTAVNKEINTEHIALPESKDFVKQRGKLKFPMEGVITQKFGRYRHKELENVYINSNGIEISGNLNAPVVAAASGKVLRISEIPGSGIALIVQHGNYYTVYSNLQSVSVSSGMNVKIGQTIAVCAPAPSDNSHAELFFQVWKNNTKLNPEDWLARP